MRKGATHFFNLIKQWREYYVFNFSGHKNGHCRSQLYNSEKLHIVVEEDFCPVKNDGLVFTTQEKDCCIEVFTDEYETPAKLFSEFTDILQEDNMYTIRNKEEDRKSDVFYSVRACYESKHNTYFEMHMVRIKGYDKSLKMLITAKKGEVDINDVIRREDVSMFIESFSE